MGHILMIFMGSIVVITHLDQFDWSVAFLMGLIALWVWDYNDINRRASNNPRSYYNVRRRRRS